MTTELTEVTEKKGEKIIYFSSFLSDLSELSGNLFFYWFGLFGFFDQLLEGGFFVDPLLDRFDGMGGEDETGEEGDHKGSGQVFWIWVRKSLRALGAWSLALTRASAAFRYFHDWLKLRRWKWIAER